MLTFQTGLYFVFLGLCLAADSPNWLGTFVIDDSCDRNQCCCLSEQATITKISETQFLVTGNVDGIPCQQQLNGSRSVSVTIPIPTDKSGYQITTPFLGTMNRFTLNADGQSIAHVNLQYPKCSAMARRAQSNWFGTYLMDDSCEQGVCCCPVGEVKISSYNQTQYLVSSKIAGRYCPTMFMEFPIPIPQERNGFQLTTFFLGSTNRFTLTSDNQYIANVNLQEELCSGMARKMSYLYTFSWAIHRRIEVHPQQENRREV